MTDEQKQVKFEVNNGHTFYSDEISVIHNPLKFFLDFKKTSPRVDVRNNQFQPLVVEHNVVMLDPYNAKQLLGILKQNIENYEKTFGEIQQPEQLSKAKEKQEQTATTTKEIHPSYFG